MKAHEALIAWTPASLEADPTAGQVRVGMLPHDGWPYWSDPYLMTGGAAYTARRKLRGDASVKALFVDFHTLVVRDCIEPQAAHQAFLAIDEYAETIAPDVPGARHRGEE